MSVEARATESTKPCEGCDLDEIDALTCEAKEIQKKAEVTTESLQTLDAPISRPPKTLTRPPGPPPRRMWMLRRPN